MIKSAGSLSKGFLLILLAVSLIWIKSSYAKWTGETVFADTLGGTLVKFASKNPNAMVKSFLENTAIPNATTFGWLTILGETFAGVGAAIAIVLLLTRKTNQTVVYLLLGSLFTGAFLNCVFWLSAGWTSASTDSLNLLMMVIQIIGFIFTLKLLQK